jgi:peptidyl-prolyl cis-trans isomerase SurA
MIAVAAGTLLAVPRPAQATVVERVVAIVGDRAIFLSDLRERAQPFLIRVETEVPVGAQRAAAISQIYSMLVERMIDEELQQRAATKSQIAVTPQEIDAALGRIASQNGVEVERLFAEARASGMNDKTYRNEIRRQVLEAKLLNLRLQGRVRVTTEDLRSAYQKLVIEERRKLRFRVAWVVLRAPLDAADNGRRRQLAERIAAQAASGADFADLAARYSDDETTRQAAGLLPQLRVGQLPPALDRAALALNVGEVSAPVRQGDSYYVLKVVEREPSSLPTFEEARDELGERVYMDKMNKARRHWLEALRRRTHVEVRL